MNLMNSTSKIIINDTNKFDEIIKILNGSLTRIKDDLESEKNKMQKINKTDVWTGMVQEKVYGKYEELSNCYSSIYESLGLYIKFLDNTLKSYVEAELTFEKDIDNNVENLNVN